MRHTRLLSLLLASSLDLPLYAQSPETGFLNRTAAVGGQTYRYQVYVPANYATNRSWPVILFLHGAGER